MIGIAFDLEGTIIDVERAHHLGHLSAAADIGLNLTLEEAINTIPSFVGGPDEIIAAKLCRLAEHRISPLDMLKKMHYFYKANLVSLPIKPRKGFTEVVEEFLKNGFPVAIGTLTCKEDALYLMDSANITRYFPMDNLIFGEDVENKKPSPEVYFKTAQRMRVDVKQQIVFEDSVTGIKSANLAGSFALAVPTIQTTDFISRLIAAGAKKVVKEWPEILQVLSLKELGDSLGEGDDNLKLAE